MTSASIYYRSHTGITKGLASNIAEVLKGKGLEVSNTEIGDDSDGVSIDPAANADLVLLGCWTGGLFLFLQHPDGPWRALARRLPSLAGKKVCLFTTYKLATGGMFKRMQRSLRDPLPSNILILRSKSSAISAEDRTRLEAWIDA